MSRARAQAAKAKPATAKVTVQITANTVVYVDGRAVLAGQTIRLPARDARQLLEQGHAHPI